MSRRIVSNGLRAVTPNDSAKLAKEGTLYIGTGGNIKVTFKSGNTETIPVTDYQDFPRIVTKVWSTGTTASDIYVDVV